MQMAKKRLTALAVAACALVALVFGGVYAIAAGDAGSNSLTVMAIKDSNLAKDVSEGTATITVDVYQIATAEKDDAYDTYNYEATGVFASCDERIKAAQANSDGGKEWKLLADEAFEKVKNAEPIATGTMGGSAGAEASVTLTGLPNGMYLVIPHGADKDAASLQASGKYAQYKFNPSVIALPTKLGSKYDTLGYIDPDEAIKTSDPGEWSNAATIALKVEEYQYGELIIQKNVTKFAGDPFTCKFTIRSTEDSPRFYQNVASVYVDSDSPASVTVTQIPAGAIVEVTETYPGAGYTWATEDDKKPQTFTIRSASEIDADPTLHVATATFTNSPDTTIVKGHGVQNTFKMVDGEWTLVEATPGSDRSPEPEPEPSDNK